MNTELQQICNTVDFASRDFSLVLVSPRESLIDRLRLIWKQKGLDRYRIYVPEENTVLVIPNTERFSEPNSLKSFLDYMKPKLLTAELARLHTSAEELGYPLEAAAFDELFDISLRDAAAIRFLSDYVTSQ